MTVIKIKSSSVQGKTPAAGDLQTAELAINLADQKLYSKDAGGTVFELGAAGDVPSGDTPPSTGNNVGDLFFDTTTNQLLYWNGSAWEEVGGGSEVLISDTPPAATDLEEGTLWWNSSEDDLQLYVLYNNGTVGSPNYNWIEASPMPGAPIGYPDIEDGDGETLDARYVKKTGDTMTGALVVDEDGIDSEIHIKSAATGGANSKLKFGSAGSANINYAEGVGNDYVAINNASKEVMRLGQNSTGDVFIPAGGLGIGGYTSPTSTILFNNDGSADFSKNVRVGHTSVTEPGFSLGHDGDMYVYRQSTNATHDFAVFRSDIGGTREDKIKFKVDGSATFERSVRSNTGYTVYPASDSDYSFATRNAADGKWSAYITGGGEGTFAGKVEAGEPTNNSVGGVRVSNAGQLRVNYCGADPADTAILIGLHKGTEYGTIFADGSANFKNTHTVTTPTADGQNAYVWLSGVDGANPSASITAGGVISGQNVTFNLEADNPANFTAEGEYTGPTLDVKGSIETATAARDAMRETFQELLVAVQSATDFGELKAAMLVALEDYAV